MNEPCPNCGYCPTCKRARGWQPGPIWVVPYWHPTDYPTYYPYYQQSTWSWQQPITSNETTWKADAVLSSETVIG